MRIPCIPFDFDVLGPKPAPKVGLHIIDVFVLNASPVDPPHVAGRGFVHRISFANDAPIIFLFRRSYIEKRGMGRMLVQYVFAIKIVDKKLRQERAGRLWYLDKYESVFVAHYHSVSTRVIRLTISSSPRLCADFSLLAGTVMVRSLCIVERWNYIFLKKNLFNRGQLFHRLYGFKRLGFNRLPIAEPWVLNFQSVLIAT